MSITNPWGEVLRTQLEVATKRPCDLRNERSRAGSHTLHGGPRRCIRPLAPSGLIAWRRARSLRRAQLSVRPYRPYTHSGRVRAALASRAPGVASSGLIMHQACIKSRGSHYSRSNPTLPHAAPHPRSTSARYVTHKASSISRNPFHLLVLYSRRLLHVHSRSLSNQCSESVDMCNNRGLDVPRLLRRRPIF